MLYSEIKSINWTENSCSVNMFSLINVGASLVAQLVKNPPAMQETLIQFLGREDPLEKGYATHSSIPGLPWWLRRQSVHL